jgi:hypothetical protein
VFFAYSLRVPTYPTVQSCSGNAIRFGQLMPRIWPARNDPQQGGTGGRILKVDRSESDRHTQQTRKHIPILELTIEVAMRLRLRWVAAGL